MNDNNVVIGEITDPAECARIHARIKRAERNLDWLSGHWSDLMPQARGKFVVVAAQQAHIAESSEEAWAWAKTVHPEDDGAIIQYVRTEIGPRIYAYRRRVASMP